MSLTLTPKEEDLTLCSSVCFDHNYKAVLRSWSVNCSDVAVMKYHSHHSGDAYRGNILSQFNATGQIAATVWTFGCQCKSVEKAFASHIITQFQNLLPNFDGREKNEKFLETTSDFCSSSHCSIRLRNSGRESSNRADKALSNVGFLDWITCPNLIYFKHSFPDIRVQPFYSYMYMDLWSKASKHATLKWCLLFD